MFHNSFFRWTKRQYKNVLLLQFSFVWIEIKCRNHWYEEGRNKKNRGKQIQKYKNKIEYYAMLHGIWIEIIIIINKRIDKSFKWESNWNYSYNYLSLSSASLSSMLWVIRSRRLRLDSWGDSTSMHSTIFFCLHEYISGLMNNKRNNKKY